MKLYDFNEIINSIHSVLHLSGQRPDNSTLNKFDVLIRDYILSNYNCEKEKRGFVHSFHEIVMSPREIEPLVLRYFAMINDNLSLLEKLKGKNFDFLVNYYNFKLYALDRDFSSKFNEEKYIDLLLNQEEVMRRFYGTIRKLPIDEKKEMISTFSEIMQVNSNLTKDPKSVDNHLLVNLMSYTNLKYFGKEFILKSTIYQRRILNSLDNFLSDDDYIKIKELLEKYPRLEPKIPLNSEVINLFTFEELNSMSHKDSVLYMQVMENGFLSRVREILHLCPSFSCPLDFLKPEILKVLSNEIIVSLSDEAKLEISRIPIPYINGVYVMPVKKINKVVSKDCKMRKKEEKKNKQHK